MSAATATSELDAEPDLPPGRYLELPGRGVTFLRDQPGPANRLPIVLLHGWTVTADLNFFTVYGGLRDLGRVLAVDLRGHGRGLRPRGPVRLEDMADDLDETLRVLAIERAIIVGYSMGGAVAQLMAHRHPARTAGLVLCSTSCRFRRSSEGRFVWDRVMPFTAAALSLAPSSLRHSLFERVAMTRTDTAPRWMLEQAARNDPAALVQSGVEIGRFDASPWLGELPMPIASVVTTADTTVPTRWQIATARRAGAQVFTVDADHHGAVSHPERFVPALRKAITAVSR